MYDELKRSFISSINTLAAAIDARDKITSGHSTRVTGYAITIAKQLGMSEDDIEVLEYAALLHDFGKMGIKDNVLCKEGKLTAEEYKHIQEHAYITYKILKNMRFSDKFKEVPEIASSHHEKYNGSGYFRGLKGEEIPYGGRILAIADVFDAITSKRHYRDRMPFLQVLNILRSDSGSHFDGSIVDEFFKLTLDKILKQMLCKYDTPLTAAETLMFSKITLEDFHQILLKNETDRSEEDNKLIKIFEKHYNPKLDDEFDALLN
ncbi:MAG: HD-GYP domain-containing protein [Ignavibacteriales bacterium]|nr:HD-GYP domain-containing protein [Ignavibacteriales bacterium]